VTLIIKRKAGAGTMQSSDLTVVVEPADRLEIRIESTVKKQYEYAIRARIEDVLARYGVTAGIVQVDDRGALDYAIEARVETALRRAAED
jgi:citrate lyase subunit gamma (acyl carrier protein)